MAPPGFTGSRDEWYAPFLHRHVIVTTPDREIRALLSDVGFNAIKLILEDGSPMLLARGQIQSLRLERSVVDRTVENRRAVFGVNPGKEVQTQ